MNRTAFAAIGIFVLLCSPLSAQVPQLISYQGRVVVGTTNFNGSGQFKFAFVNAAGSTTYWSNDGSSTAGSEPTNPVSLTVANGLYSVLLGDTSITNMTVAVPVSVFINSDVRLRVWFNDGTHGSQLLAPDQRIASVGYAMMAASVPTVTNGTWNTSVGTYQNTSNVFGIYNNNALVLGMSANGSLFNGKLSVNGTFNATSVSLNGGGSISNNGDGDVVIGGSQGNVVIDGDIIGAIPQMQVFDASGTFVVPTNVTKVLLEMWGAGGGGGGAYEAFNGSVYCCSVNGGCGGGGTYAKGVFEVTPGASYSVTVDAGGAAGFNVINGPGSTGGNAGTTSFGNLLSAGGGFGGGGANSNQCGGAGGPGGTSGGTLPQQLFFVNGGSGAAGCSPIASGGAAPSGGVGGFLTNAGNLPGGGGGGGGLSNSAGAMGAPGKGAPGRVIVFY